MACGRIVGVAQAIARVYRLQAASEGTLVPWTEEYHREAVHIYSMSLPRSYQRDFAALFRDSVETMDAMSIPASLADDWVIIEQYPGQPFNRAVAGFWGIEIRAASEDTGIGDGRAHSAGNHPL